MSPIQAKIKKLFLNKFVGVLGVLIFLLAFFYLNFYVFADEPEVMHGKGISIEKPVGDGESNSRGDSAKISIPLNSSFLVKKLIHHFSNILPVS
ncbi:MAG: hypothetical protein H6581_27580 [Bacteroidia bacterium]|nr:hypothetical protein [Bacteroidia bacterium]